MPDINREFKIWLPSSWTPAYYIYIDGEDVTSEVMSAEFTHGIVGTDCICKISLINAQGEYSNSITGGETIELKADMEEGTTSIWKGTLDAPKKKFGATYQLDVVGSHYQSSLLDITATEEYTEQLSSDIISNLITSYMTGYAITGVEATTEPTTIKLSNKPLHDCVLDICDISECDAYIDSEKIVYFFAKESNVSEDVALIWNDTLLEISDFGTDQVDIKNRIIIYGEDNAGLPIIYQADDTTSQTSNGIKEKVVKDSSVKTYEQAKAMGDGLLEQEKSAANKGEMTGLFAPSLKPGDMIWISHPVLGIEDTFRVVKFTHKFPELTTSIVISKDKTVPALFKERAKADLAKENLSNPYKMTGSFNLDFDVESDYDSGASSTISISESKLQIASGSELGIMVSKRREASSDITSVHLKVNGDVLSGATYYVSVNDGEDWEQLSAEELTTLSSTGTNLRIKINMTNTSTRIDSVAVLYK